jgi:hypothetical protein
VISPTAPGLTQEQRDLLQQRYGPGRRRPVALLAVLGVVALTFVTWVVWAGLQQSAADVRWQTFGYSDVSDTSVTVEFDVFKDQGQPVTCTVQALDVSGEIVGQARVDLTVDEGDVHLTYALPVTRRPTSALVDSCTALDG